MRRCTLSINVFSTKVLIGDTIFYVSNWRRDRHFTWSSDPRQSLAACTAEGVPSLLTYFKTLSIGSALGIEPATSRSAVKLTLVRSTHALYALEHATREKSSQSHYQQWITSLLPASFCRPRT